MHSLHPYASLCAPLLALFLAVSSLTCIFHSLWHLTLQ
ncbi:hypothetical protein X975_10969, partial [Stegodyphus mimosarum]